MSSVQKVPKVVKEQPALLVVTDKFSSFHQPVMASHSIRLSIISLAFHAQHRKKTTIILQMKQTRRLSV